MVEINPSFTSKSAGADLMKISSDRLSGNLPFSKVIQHSLAFSMAYGHPYQKFLHSSQRIGTLVVLQLFVRKDCTSATLKLGHVQQMMSLQRCPVGQANLMGGFLTSISFCICHASHHVDLNTGGTIARLLMDSTIDGSVVLV